MSMKQIRDYYGVPAKRGGRVEGVGGRLGTIKSARDLRLMILFDGSNFVRQVHPTRALTYL